MPENELEKLQNELAILKRENQDLLERAEDTLLLQLVAESIEQSDTPTSLIETALERAAILKNLPFCVCAEIENDGLKPLCWYTPLSESNKIEIALHWSPDLTMQISSSAVILEKDDFDSHNLNYRFLDPEFIPGSIAFMPLHSRWSLDTVIVFFDDRTRRLGRLKLLLMRLVGMIAERLNTLLLIKELKELNRELDHRVGIRTRTLQRKNEELHTLNNQYRLLADNSADVIFTMDQELNLNFISPSISRLLGFSMEKAKMMGFQNLTDPVSFTHLKTKLAPIADSDHVKSNDRYESYRIELNMIHKKGHGIPVELNISPLRRDEGEKLGFVGIARDISRRKRAEQKLINSERRNRIILEQSPVGIFHYDAQGILLDCNQKFTALLEIDPAQVLGMNLPEEFENNQIETAIFESLEHGEIQYEDWNHAGLRSKNTFLRVHLKAIRDDDGTIIGGLGIVTDITKESTALRALEESEGKLRKLFERSTDAIFIVNSETGRYLDANKAAEKLVGRTRADLLSKTTRDITPKGASTRLSQIKKIEETMDAGLVTYLRPNGQERTALLTVIPIESNIVFGLAHDITNELKANDALKLLKQAMEQSPTSIIITNTEGTIEYVNDQFSRTTGYSSTEAIGRNPRFLRSGEHDASFYHNLWSTILSGRIWRGEMRNRKKSGEKHWELVSISGVQNVTGQTTHFIAFKEDITIRKQKEIETVRQERLAAVGHLAAGIAHDFNNLMTTIVGSAELVCMKEDISQTVREKLQNIIEQGHRASKLTRQILDFSRQTANEPKRLDFKKFLTETMTFIERAIPENIQIMEHFERGNFTIFVDPVQMQQVLMNLAINARDAMPFGGQLLFQLRRSSLSKIQPLDSQDLARDEDWIQLCVTDTGKGIPAEHLSRIFEPFFTTKELGKGTGLGLAQVYGIVKQNNGLIETESTPGKGTTFKLSFPSITPHAEQGEPGHFSVPKGDNQLILLVEDSDEVRTILEQQLLVLGYRVCAAENGQKALDLFKKNPQEFDLVLTDYMMPEMDGLELIGVLSIEAPKLPAILVSGYSPREELSPSHHPNLIGRLQKPVELSLLAACLQRALSKH